MVFWGAISRGWDTGISTNLPMFLYHFGPSFTSNSAGGGRFTGYDSYPQVCGAFLYYSLERDTRLGNRDSRGLIFPHHPVLSFTSTKCAVPSVPAGDTTEGGVAVVRFGLNTYQARIDPASARAPLTCLCWVVRHQEALSSDGRRPTR